MEVIGNGSCFGFILAGKSGGDISVKVVQVLSGWGCDKYPSLGSTGSWYVVYWCVCMALICGNCTLLRVTSSDCAEAAADDTPSSRGRLARPRGWSAAAIMVRGLRRSTLLHLAYCSGANALSRWTGQFTELKKNGLLTTIRRVCILFVHFKSCILVNNLRSTYSTSHAKTQHQTDSSLCRVVDKRLERCCRRGGSPHPWQVRT